MWRRARRYFSGVAADKSDEPGVLGNLPRSRPGQRSDKRATAAKGKSSPRGARATKASKSATARRARPAPKPEPPRRPEPEAPRSADPAAHRSTDPLTGAVRLAGRVAEAGLKTAGDLLRRLPGR
jgi:hypothetical protein